MITQIILAAGLSSRMRQPKPLLDFCGVPLLSHLLGECRQSPVDRIIVVLGHAREEILRRVCFTGATVAINEDYRTGQTGSLQCGLRLAGPDTDAFINLPVDHPLVTHREINALVKAYRSRSPNQQLFIPVFQNQEGRPVLFDKAFLKEIRALGPDEPVKAILEAHRDLVSRVPIDNPYTMKDMDTPGDYRECLSVFRSLRQRRQTGA